MTPDLLKAILAMDAYNRTNDEVTTRGLHMTKTAARAPHAPPICPIAARSWKREFGLIAAYIGGAVDSPPLAGPACAEAKTNIVVG
jgi:hypothetical protein